MLYGVYLDEVALAAEVEGVHLVLLRRVALLFRAYGVCGLGFRVQDSKPRRPQSSGTPHTLHPTTHTSIVGV